MQCGAHLILGSYSFFLVAVKAPQLLEIQDFNLASGWEIFREIRNGLRFVFLFGVGSVKVRYAERGYWIY